MVEVPWRKARADADAVTSARSASPSGRDVGAREDLIARPDVNELPQQEEAVPQPVTSAVASDGESDEVGDEVGSEYASDRQQVVASEKNPEASYSPDNRAPSTQPDHTDLSSETVASVGDESSSVESTPDGEGKPQQTRVLLWKHFEVALGEIRPSSSEEGSLPELRKVSLTSKAERSDTF